MCGTGDIVFFVIFVVGFVTYRVILETMKSVLVTGASGFIGSYIVSEGIEGVPGVGWCEGVEFSSLSDG